MMLSVIQYSYERERDPGAEPPKELGNMLRDARARFEYLDGEVPLYSSPDGSGSGAGSSTRTRVDFNTYLVPPPPFVVRIVAWRIWVYLHCARILRVAEEGRLEDYAQMCFLNPVEVMALYHETEAAIYPNSPNSYGLRLEGVPTHEVEIYVMGYVNAREGIPVPLEHIIFGTR